MPYNDKKDNREIYHSHSSWDLKFDEPHIKHPDIDKNDEKKSYVVTLTSNDEIMHIPSIVEAFRDTFHKFTVDEEWLNNTINSLIDAIKKNDKMTTNRWEFAIPLIGPDMNQLVIQVYPTYASWRHLREKRELEDD